MLTFSSPQVHICWTEFRHFQNVGFILNRISDPESKMLSAALHFAYISPLFALTSVKNNHIAVWFFVDNTGVHNTWCIGRGQRSRQVDTAELVFYDAVISQGDNTGQTDRQTDEQ